MKKKLKPRRMTLPKQRFSGKKVFTERDSSAFCVGYSGSIAVYIEPKYAKKILAFMQETVAYYQEREP